MIYAISDVRPARLVVLSYDISSPARARQVRRVLDAVHHAKQYSVYEALLCEGTLRGVLAEVSACCDFDSDLLAAWWPAQGLRLGWTDGQLRIEARRGEPQAPQPLPPQASFGNYVVCYDVSNPDALRRVAAEVASAGAMLQRSVYWLRLPRAQVTAILGRCAAHLDAGDRLWAYPLNGSGDLWRIGAPPSAVLPMHTHRWRTP